MGDDTPATRWNMHCRQTKKGRSILPRAWAEKRRKTLKTVRLNAPAEFRRVGAFQQAEKQPNRPSDAGKSKFLSEIVLSKQYSARFLFGIVQKTNVCSGGTSAERNCPRKKKLNRYENGVKNAKNSKDDPKRAHKMLSASLAA